MRENGLGRFQAVFLAFLHLSCRRSHALEQLGMGTLVASSTTSPPPFHQNRCYPGWFITLDGPPPEEALPPVVLGMPRGQKRLNGRFWGHCVGEAVGVPRTPGGRASSGGGPPRVIYHPGQRRFWCNGGGSRCARGQGPTLLSSETPQTSSCGEAGARKISGVCRPFRDPSCLPRLPNMLN